MTTDRFPPEARARLGALVERERRIQRRSKKAVGGGSWEVYEGLREGRPVQDKTLRLVEQVLGLAAFACDEVLAGAEVLRHAEPGEGRDAEAVVIARAFAAMGEIHEGLAAATPDEVLQIAELLAPARARARAKQQK